jgi:hypothetical protein
MFQEGRNDDEFYIRNNFEKFKERYEKRIKNFRDYLENEKEIIFIFHSYTDEQIKILNELLSKRYNNNFKFMCI